MQKKGGEMSTVLAQDHFYSDFLSLHVTVKTNNKAMMMFDHFFALGRMPQETAGLRTSHLAAEKSAEWRAIKHSSTPTVWLPVVDA